jgi:hypothetical protein
MQREEAEGGLTMKLKKMVARKLGCWWWCRRGV